MAKVKHKCVICGSTFLANPNTNARTCHLHRNRRTYYGLYFRLIKEKIDTVNSHFTYTKLLKTNGRMNIAFFPSRDTIGNAVTKIDNYEYYVNALERAVSELKSDLVVAKRLLKKQQQEKELEEQNKSEDMN